MSRLEIESLKIAYGGWVAIDDLNLTIEKGELVSLLGPSGSGKTSLLRAIGGYLKPAGGSMRIDGKDITAIPPQFRDIGMVFQNFVLFPHLSTVENVEFGLRTRGVAKAERRRRAIEALAMVQMDTYLDRYPFELSGGQQQRVALARAIVIRPTLLLLDEPMGALDTKLRERAQEEIRALQQELQLTTVLVTHDQREAMAMSDRIIVMRSGSIIDAGDPWRLYHAPKTAFTAEFLGTTNLLSVEVLTRDGNRARVRMTQTGHEFEVEGSLSGANAGYVSLRPEDITCTSRSEPGALPAKVMKRMFYGVNTHLRLETPELGSLLAVQHRHAVFEEGAELFVSFQPQDARLLPADPPEDRR
ncbi:ABC transporter ATP-binding protein [Bosea sp. 117]|uniref:ABC transporter ATP-binding protein n=1 Tax=Bosea sp. 117 TaxID=1125973 RepID=UPI00056E0DCB|nr:ABC transporter ATP-binding protein [Bosea sp. 117]